MKNNRRKIGILGLIATILTMIAGHNLFQMILDKQEQLPPMAYEILITIGVIAIGASVFLIFNNKE